MDEYDYKEMMDRNQYFAGLDEEKIERLEGVVSDLYEALEELLNYLQIESDARTFDETKHFFRGCAKALAKAKGQDHE